MLGYLQESKGWLCEPWLKKSQNRGTTYNPGPSLWATTLQCHHYVMKPHLCSVQDLKFLENEPGHLPWATLLEPSAVPVAGSSWTDWATSPALRPVCSLWFGSQNSVLIYHPEVLHLGWMISFWGKRKIKWVSFLFLSMAIPLCPAFLYLRTLATVPFCHLAWCP